MDRHKPFSCLTCGSGTAPGDRFCWKCGERLSADREDKIAVARTGWRKIFLVLTAFVLAGVMAAVIREGTQSEKLIATLESTQAEDAWKKNTLVISPDGKQIAYVDWNGETFVSRNGKPEKSYESIDERYIAFSPDSTKLAYMVSSEKSEFVVVNGKEEKHYSGSVSGPAGGPFQPIAFLQP